MSVKVIHTHFRVVKELIYFFQFFLNLSFMPIANNDKKQGERFSN